MGQTEPNGDSLVGKHMITDEERGIADLPADVIPEAFYGDCTEEDLALAQTLLRPEPLGPNRVLVNTTAERFGGVRRVFIETLEDQAVMPEFQASMYADRPCDADYSSETSHASFFSAPPISSTTALGLGLLGKVSVNTIDIATTRRWRKSRGL